MNYYSQSGIKAWRRCHKMYDYKYRQGLVRKTSPAALIRGTTFHSLLEAHALGKDWKPFLEEYRKVYQGLWDEEAEGFSTPEEIESLFHRYCEFWKDDGLQFNGMCELELKVPSPIPGIGFKGIIDKIATDTRGLSWVMDHKTHKIIPDENTRFSDIQTVLYYWACLQSGIKVDGVLWDYIRTKPPTQVEVLKKGGLTRRANLDTDYATYMKAIRDNGLNPADYQEELARVKNNTWFKRVPLPSPSKALIESVVSDFFSTAQEIENSHSQVRNMTRDCKGCSYFQLCSAEVRGLDGEFIKKQMFTIKEIK